MEIRTGILKRNTTSISTEIQALILIILQVLIVVGNTLTMLIVLRLRKRLVVVDMLIFSLALVDAMNALTSVTVAILIRFLILRDHEIPWQLCQAQGWCIVAFEMMSVCIISMICFDRFVAIVKPFWHLRQMTCTRTVKAVVFISLFSCLTASLPVFGWDSYRQLDWLALCLFNYQSSYAIFIAIIGYIQLIFVLISSVAIVYSLSRFSKRQRKFKAKDIPNRNTKYSLRTERRQKTTIRTQAQRQGRQLAKIGMVVVVFFYMSWLPLMVSYY